MIISTYFIFVLLICSLHLNNGINNVKTNKLSVIWKKFSKISTATVASICILSSAVAETTQSNLLTTTVRSSYDSEDAKQQPKLWQLWKSKLNTNILRTESSIANLDVNSIPQSASSIFKNIPSNFEIGLGFLLSILWIEAANSAGDYKQLSDEYYLNITSMSQKIKNLEITLEDKQKIQEINKASDVSDIEQSLRGQINDLLLQISTQDKDIVSLSDSLDKLSRELDRNKPSSSSSAVVTKVVEDDSSLTKLKLKLDDLEKEKLINMERDKKIIDSLKKFFVSAGILPQGIANMLLLGTLDETLKSLVEKKLPSFLIDESSLMEKQQLKEQLSQSQQSLSSLSSEWKAKEDSWIQKDKLIADLLAAEVLRSKELELQIVEIKSELDKSVSNTDEVLSAVQGELSAWKTKYDNLLLEQKNKDVATKKQIEEEARREKIPHDEDKLKTTTTSNNEKAFETLTFEMNSKLEAAKTMTKELNGKLVAKEKELDALETKMTEMLKSAEKVNEKLQQELDDLKSSTKLPNDSTTTTTTTTVATSIGFSEKKSVKKGSAKSLSNKNVISDQSTVNPEISKDEKTSNPIKTMSKKQLEDYVVQLNLTTQDKKIDGKPISKILKGDLIALIEKKTLEK